MATTITVLDQFQVKPAPSATPTSEMHLPLSYLDMIFLHFSPIQRLMFYEIPHLSKSQFVDHIIPKLRFSLSLTLKHFLPLAGNLIIPSPDTDSGMPEILYRPGNDGVKFVTAEWDGMDFNHLVANDERYCAEFYPLIPEMHSSLQKKIDDHSGSGISTASVLALQITLFPDVGLCIGISNHHTVGDGHSMFNFMKTWAKLSQDAEADAEFYLVTEPKPVFDKTWIKDTNGICKIVLDAWDSAIRRLKSTGAGFESSKPEKVRKTFVISQKDVEKLKNLVSREQGNSKSVHVSSFTLICSFVWTCLLKSRLNQEVGHSIDSETQYFSFVANCRGRSDPAAPENYFGNFLTPCSTGAEHAKLVGEGGFQMGVELLGRAIHEKFMRKDAVFDGFGTLFGTLMNLNWERVVSVAGAPRYNFYNLDFGWGKPIKCEVVSIDQTGAISLSGCRDSDGSVEVGVSLIKPEMDAFSAIFMEESWMFR